MSVLNFFVKEYTGPGDWILVSRLLLNSAGIGRRFSVECCEGLVWCCEFVVDEVAGRSRKAGRSTPTRSLYSPDLFQPKQVRDRRVSSPGLT